MDYVAPKLVSLHQFQFQPVVFPPGQEYWWLGWTEDRNVPEPEVNNFTGPKGRLKWISPLALHWHEISPSHDLDRMDSKEWRLSRKGWVGLSTSYIGDVEKRAIKRHVDALGADVYKMRPYTLEDNDMRPGDIGRFTEHGRCFYFRTEELRAEMIAMLEAIPPRTVEMYVDHRRMDAKCKLALRGLNWHVWKGEDADLLTVEESVPSTALMLIRLSAGVAKPT